MSCDSHSQSSTPSSGNARNYAQGASIPRYVPGCRHRVDSLHLSILMTYRTPVARFKTGLHPRSWELSPEPATFATSNRWSNEDMDPGECARRPLEHRGTVAPASFLSLGHHPNTFEY